MRFIAFLQLKAIKEEKTISKTKTDFCGTRPLKAMTNEIQEIIQRFTKLRALLCSSFNFYLYFTPTGRIQTQTIYFISVIPKKNKLEKKSN